MLPWAEVTSDSRLSRLVIFRCVQVVKVWQECHLSRKQNSGFAAGSRSCCASVRPVHQVAGPGMRWRYQVYRFLHTQRLVIVLNGLVCGMASLVVFSFLGYA